MKSLLEVLENRFFTIHHCSVSLVKMIPPEKLYWSPLERKALLPGKNSCGESILRSAAAVEQAFGGITTKLWDDPFEWTLPEALPTNELILQYLEEVDETRRKGFAFFGSDEDLYKKIPAPDKLKSIFEILLETIARAEHFQGRAYSVFQLISDKKLSRHY
jgi:hypothetical protein